MANNAKWFVVHTYSGYENKVASNIATAVQNRKMQDQILEIKIPTQRVVSTVDKKIKTVKVNKKGEKKIVTDFKLEIKGERLVIINQEVDENGEGILTVVGENGKERKYKIVKFDVDEKGEETITVRYEKEVEQMLYPGYVILKVACIYKKRGEFEEEELSMTDEAWYIIRNTRGVTGFVGPGSKPVPLSDDEVIALGIEIKTFEINYKPGDFVTILSGSFDGFSGVIDSIDVEKKTVVVMISMFGRETPVELAITEIEANEY